MHTSFGIYVILNTNYNPKARRHFRRTQRFWWQLSEEPWLLHLQARFCRHYGLQTLPSRQCLALLQSPIEWSYERIYNRSNVRSYVKYQLLYEDFYSMDFQNRRLPFLTLNGDLMSISSTSQVSCWEGKSFLSQKCKWGCYEIFLPVEKSSQGMQLWILVTRDAPR